MKRNRLLALLLTLLMFAAAATACGASGGNTAANDSVATSASGGAAETPQQPTVEMDGFADEESAAAQNGNIPANAKLIYTGDLTLQATDLDAAAQGLAQLVDGYGGYIESQEIYRQSSYKNAYYTVRVPGDRFAAFINSVSESELCTVTYQSTSTQNVGEQHADIENRLETLSIKLDRLQSLLAKAESMEDIITIESSISEVEYEIELYSGEKNHYDSLISFSTVYITLNEVKTAGAGVDPTLAERLSSGFKRGLGSFADGCEDFLVWFVTNLIGIIIFLVIAAIVLTVILRRRRNRIAEHKARMEQKAEDSKPHQ